MCPYKTVRTFPLQLPGTKNSEGLESGRELFYSGRAQINNNPNPGGLVVKVSVDQKLLTKKIQGISAVVPTKTSLPILSTFLMEAKKDKIYLTANDLDVSLTTIVDCNVEAEGKIAVPGKKFFEIIRSLADGAVERLMEEHRSGKRNHQHRLWALLMLAAWAEELL